MRDDARGPGEPLDGPVLCDTEAMVVVHAFFLAQFGEAPALVARARDGGPARVSYVAEHLAFLIDALHHHHEGEDGLVWDNLEQRAPSCALHVARMRTQHAHMRRHLDAFEGTLPRWRGSDGAEGEAEVAAALVQVIDSLRLHLPDEENSVLPAISRTFTAREWNALGARARRLTPRGKRWIQLGSMRAALGDGAGDAWMRAELPWVVVAWWRWRGSRVYRTHRARLGAVA